MRRATVGAIVGLAAFIQGGVAWSATLHVGGGGEYVRIQDAIDAAAPGDTIRIASGWYSDWTLFEDDPLYARITKDALTFIGAGADQTFVGPAVYHHEQFHSSTAFYAKASWGVQEVAFEDLTAINTDLGIRCDGPALRVLRCGVSAAFAGINASLPLGGDIGACEFHGLENEFVTGVSLAAPSTDVSIAGCIFRDCSFNGISHIGSGTVDVFDCQFVHCGTGVQLQAGPTGTISNCTFSGLTGVVLAGWASCAIRDCIFEEATNYNLYISRSALTGLYNVFGGGGRSTIYMEEGPSTVEMHFSHIFSAGTPYVMCWGFESPPVQTMHLESNYWGINDAAGIYANMELCPNLAVEVEPLADGPVPTEAVTWGAVKSLFRDQGQ